eukprot:3106715-Prymnesium_polylepis.1
MRNDPMRAQSAGHARGARDVNAAAASRHAQQPFSDRRDAGGRPDSPPAGAGLAVKEPAMSADGGL